MRARGPRGAGRAVGANAQSCLHAAATRSGRCGRRTVPSHPRAQPRAVSAGDRAAGRVAAVRPAGPAHDRRRGPRRTDPPAARSARCRRPTPGAAPPRHPVAHGGPDRAHHRTHDGTREQRPAAGIGGRQHGGQDDGRERADRSEATTVQPMRASRRSRSRRSRMRRTSARRCSKRTARSVASARARSRSAGRGPRGRHRSRLVHPWPSSAIDVGGRGGSARHEDARRGPIGHDAATTRPVAARRRTLGGPVRRAAAPVPFRGVACTVRDLRSGVPVPRPPRTGRLRPTATRDQHDPPSTCRPPLPRCRAGTAARHRRCHRHLPPGPRPRSRGLRW